MSAVFILNLPPNLKSCCSSLSPFVRQPCILHVQRSFVGLMRSKELRHCSFLGVVFIFYNNNMKTPVSLLFIISVFKNGVFGDKVSVMEGDSVTLHNDRTDLQRVDLMIWRFNGIRIAQINREFNENLVYDTDERFTDRLKMNPQTGDLTITNITSQHTGDYEVSLHIPGQTPTKTFSVSLSPKVKKVINKDSVSLHIDVTDEQRNDKIHWKIKHNNSPVAEIITENGKISTPFIDERFRDRLKLDDQTGDLIITNMKNEDSGQYEADVTIGSSTYTIHKTFSFTDSEVGGSSGLSSGVIAGICVGVLLVGAAAVAGLFCSRSRTQ